jgi:tRNA(Ile)-lysidine synthase
MIQAKVKSTIEKKGLIKKGDKVLVGVSGGPDSMALLHLLVDLRKEYNIELIVAHLDHMLRGKQSNADANFVEEIAIKLNTPFIMGRSNVKAIASSAKMSIEEAARETRYDFFQKTAAKVGATKIATAHNMDDQAETVLMRLIKGSGSLGLSGIPYKRRLGDKWIIRPLLDVKRVDIEKYLKRRKIPSRLDASNLKTLYLRNKIRHILIPLLEKEFNRKIKENLNLIARNLSDEFNYLSTTTRRLCKRFAVETETAIEIDIKKLLRQHVALQRLIVREIIFKLKGDLRRINYKHWQEVESMFYDVNKLNVDLPGGLKAVKKHNRLIFTRRGVTKERASQFNKTIKLNVPGKIMIPELNIEARAEIVKYMPKFKKGKSTKGVEYINGDLITLPLLIRTWRDGDRMKPLGVKFHKKLHDIFVDEKVPREIRDSIPLIFSGDKILWAVGVKLSEDYKIDKETRRVVKLTVNSIMKN